MKINNLKLYSLALATGFILILSSCSKEKNLNDMADSSTSGLKASGPSANGQGTFMYNNLKRHFSFHANTMPNGTVKGSGVLTYNGNSVQIKFDINCMSINANTATMSGNVTSSNQAAWPAGTPCAFKVVDNGEGSSSIDEITLLQQSPSYDCLTWPGLPLNPIDGGNIQVKP